MLCTQPLLLPVQVPPCSLMPAPEESCKVGCLQVGDLQASVYASLQSAVQRALRGSQQF